MARETDSAILKVASRIGNKMEGRGKSDRSVALVGASFLDAHLRELLVSFMLDEPAEVEILLGSESPLGAFGPRIRAAYCLGLISRDERDDLRLINAIQDYFSSQLQEVSFTDEGLVPLCYQLHFPQKMIPEWRSQAPRQLYVMTVSILVHQLSLRIRQAEQFRRQLNEDFNLVELEE